MTHPDEDASTRGLSLLVETQPSDYFTPRNVTTKDSSKLVLCCLWEALVAGKLIDVEDQVHKNVHVHHNVVLYQLLDVFDAGAANGIPGIVLDTFREVQPEAIVEYCGITAAECVLKWIARTVEGCAATLAGLSGLSAEDNGLVGVRRTLVRVEAAREAALYALSWQDMERSFHQIKGVERQGMGVSGPMSQAVVQNFKEMAEVASRVSVVAKCVLAVVEAGSESIKSIKSIKSVGRDGGWLERCRNAEGSLLAKVGGGFEKFGGITGESLGGDLKGLAVGLLMGYMEGRHGDGDGHHRGASTKEVELLVLLVYLMPEEGVVESLARYFPALAADLRVWALAPLLDEARVEGDDVPLHAVLTAISSGRLDRRRMPMAYLLALLELRQSSLVLSLLYQKWIDPTVVEDVLGCIDILMHEELIIECYVHVKQYLRQLQEMSRCGGGGIQAHRRPYHPYHTHDTHDTHDTHRTYHHTAKIFWQAMFSAGAERGMLFQLIRLPITAKDEVHIVDWLRCGDVEKGKALCLYYLLRGRTDEAMREVMRMDLDDESEWDARLAQLCELANQSAPVIEIHGDVSGDAMVGTPGCMRWSDSREATTPGQAVGGGLLFGAPVEHKGLDEVGAGSRTNPSMAGVFDAPSAVHAGGVRGRVTRSVRGSSKVHKLDKMLGDFQ